MSTNIPTQKSDMSAYWNICEVCKQTGVKPRRRKKRLTDFFAQEEIDMLGWICFHFKHRYQGSKGFRKELKFATSVIKRIDQEESK